MLAEFGYPLFFIIIIAMDKREYLLSLPQEEFECFKENELYGYRTKFGDVVAPAEYTYIGEKIWFDSYIEVCKDGKWGYLNKAGEVVLDIIYDDFFWFRHVFYPEKSLCFIERDGKFGMLDKNLEVVIPVAYDSLSTCFNNGLVAAQVGEKCGYINIKNETVIDFRFEANGNFVEDVATVKIDGKYGYINTDGKFVIQPQFDYACSFCEGLAAVMKDDLWGFIDKTGELVIPMIYDDVYSFSDGKACVLKDGEEFYINKPGEIVEE